MPDLILIKHAMPTINPEQPANSWHLSETGRARAHKLGQEIASYEPTVLLASTEPKARQTGAAIGQTLSLPCLGKPGLHEHDRHNVSFMADSSAFKASVKALFDQPETLVFGGETAQQAAQRFIRTVNAVLNPYPNQNVAIVAHGTVIALFVAHFNPEVNPFDLWARLGLPSYVVLSRPDYTLQTIVESV